MRQSTTRGSALRIVLPMALVWLVCLAIAPAALSGPLRNIVDPDATPSFTITSNGYGVSRDAAFGVAVRGGAAYVAGVAGNAAGNSDATLAKIANGAQSWRKSYDGPAHKYDLALDLAIGPGGVVYTAGGSQNAIDKEDFLVVKWSPSGKVLWARRYDGPLHGDDRAYDLGVDKYGNVTVAGVSQGTGDKDWAVVSWSSSGVKRWVWRYDGSAHAGDYPADVIVTPSGDVYVTGGVVVSGPKDAALTVRFSRTGKKLWSRLYLGISSLGAGTGGMTPRPGGGVITCGYTEAVLTAGDGLVMSYTPAGKRLAFVPDAGVNGQYFSDVAVASNGTIVAVGRDLSAGTRARVRLYRKDGSPLGAGTSGGGAWGATFAAVATDRFGGYYPVGYYKSSDTESQLWTWRLPVVAGGGTWASLWGPADLHSVGERNEAHAIAVSGTTVYVVGDYYTVAEGWNQVVLVYIY